MKNTTPLPTANLDWGFWGTSVRSGYDAPMAWDTASRVLAEAFNLTPEQTRDILDARFGRHLSDELSFIKGGPATEAAIADYIKMRIADRKWTGYFRKAIEEISA